MKKTMLKILSLAAVLVISSCGGPKTIDYEYNGTKGSYTGEMEGKIPNGTGEFVTENSSYKGNWVNGKPEGEGESSIVEGEVTRTYSGSWSDGKPDGSGVIKETAQGITRTYTGEVINGKKNGTGELVINRSGFITKYTGDFVNDKGTGQGVVVSNVGGGLVTYEGAVVDIKAEGSGTMTIEGNDGVTRIYKGSFADGAPFGYTEYRCIDSDNEIQLIIKGEFSGLEDISNGSLYTLTDLSGNLYDSGIYFNGQLISDYEETEEETKPVETPSQTEEGESALSKFLWAAGGYIADKAGFGDEFDFAEGVFRD